MSDIMDAAQELVLPEAEFGKLRYRKTKKPADTPGSCRFQFKFGGFTSYGDGYSRKEARQEAAANMIDLLIANGTAPEQVIRNEMYEAKMKGLRKEHEKEINALKRAQLKYGIMTLDMIIRSLMVQGCWMGNAEAEEIEKQLKAAVEPFGCTFHSWVTLERGIYSVAFLVPETPFMIETEHGDDNEGTVRARGLLNLAGKFRGRLDVKLAVLRDQSRNY